MDLSQGWIGKYTYVENIFGRWEKKERQKERKKESWVHKNQCCGSVTFWYCSGFTYQYFWLMDPDSALTPDPDPGLGGSGNTG